MTTIKDFISGCLNKATALLYLVSRGKMDKLQRLQAVKEAMQLAQVYNEAMRLGGQVSSEGRLLMALADEYEQLCGIVLNQQSTILELTAERNGEAPISTIENTTAEPDKPQDVESAQLFDIVPDGTSITINRSE
jgi:hypothetical protein